MYNINFCPTCNSTNVELKPSKLARFVASRITQKLVDDNIDNNAIVCNECNFIGSQLRFTEIEEQYLYKDYRGEDYNKLRVLCEPNYLERMNSFDQKEYVEKRAVGINYLIKRYIDKEQINTLLDFGGDSGLFIPSYFDKSKKYVLDISNNDTLPTIEKINLDSNIKVDFLMCCHVIEHSSDLEKIFLEIDKFITKNAWVYFEVPNYPTPTVPNAFHEHINIFNKKSLCSLLTRHNFIVIDTFENENLCVLTRRG